MMAVDLGGSVSMKFRRIPAGKFRMGNERETPAESPVSTVEIEKPFWMGEAEVTLEQYRRFDPEYLNGWYDMHYKDQVRPGYDMDADPRFPVIRVPWTRAMEFCRWLSGKPGKGHAAHGSAVGIRGQGRRGYGLLLRGTGCGLLRVRQPGGRDAEGAGRFRRGPQAD